MEARIVPYEPAHLDTVVQLALRAWAPVFPKMREEMPPFVYDAFYPDGWKTRQATDVAALCQDESTAMWVALIGDQVAGFVGLRAHPEDSMGEVHIIAVDPAYQRRGIAAQMLDFAAGWMRERRLSIAMIETGGDAGHAPSRATYERAGYSLLPVARYFREI